MYKPMGFVEFVKTPSLFPMLKTPLYTLFIQLSPQDCIWGSCIIVCQWSMLDTLITLTKFVIATSVGYMLKSGHLVKHPPLTSFCPLYKLSTFNFSLSIFSLIFLAGSMMKTERMVNAMPFSLMLSRSSCAIMSQRKATLRSASAMMGNLTVVFCVSLISSTHWSWELRSLAL